MTIPNTPSSFTLLPAIQYGEAADMLPWDAQLFMDILCPSPLPTNPAPAIIYMHGGGWSEGERSAGLYPWLNPLLAAHGFWFDLAGKAARQKEGGPNPFIDPSELGRHLTEMEADLNQALQAQERQR